jgi:hypothetical protein
MHFQKISQADIQKAVDEFLALLKTDNSSGNPDSSTGHPDNTTGNADNSTGNPYNSSDIQYSLTAAVKSEDQQVTIL